MIVRQQRLRAWESWAVESSANFLAGLRAGTNMGTTGARDFPGTDEKFTLATNPDPGTSDFHLSFWARRDTGVLAMPWCTGGASAGQDGFLVQFTAAGDVSIYICDSVYSGTVIQDSTSGTPIVTGQWHFYTLNYDRDGNAVLYMDGSESAAITLDITDVQATLGATYGYIGGYTSAQFLDGQMSRIGFGTGLLDAVDRAELYNGGNGKFAAELSATLSAKMTYYWNGNEGASNAALVSQIGTNNGTKGGTGNITAATGPREATAADLVGGYNGILTGFADTVTPWEVDTPDGSYTTTKEDAIGTDDATMTGFSDVDAAHVDGPVGSFGPHIPDQGSGADDGWLNGNLGDSRSFLVPKDRFVGGSVSCFSQAYDEPPNGGSRAIDGVDQKFTATSALTFGTSGDITFEFWYYAEDADEAGYLIESGATSAPSPGFNCYHDTRTSSNFVRMEASDGTTKWSSTPNAALPAFNRWYHFVFILSRTDDAFYTYVNGTLAATQTSVGFTSNNMDPSAAFDIGSSGSGSYAKGRFSRVRIAQNYQYTAADVATTYNGGSPLNYADLPSALQTNITAAYDMTATGTADESDLVGTNDLSVSGTDTSVNQARGPFLFAYDLELNGFTSSQRDNSDLPSGWSGMQAITFDGSSEYGTTDEKTVTGRGARTVAIAFKRNGTPAASERLMGENSGTSTNYGAELYLTSAGYLGAIISDGSGSYLAAYEGTVNLCDNAWHTAVLTWDGTTGTNKFILYVDGTSTGTDTATGTDQGGESTYDFQVSGYGGANDLYGGKICLPAVTAGRAWTSAEVTAYNSSGTLPSDVTASWDFNEQDVCQLAASHSFQGNGTNRYVRIPVTGSIDIEDDNKSGSMWVYVPSTGAGYDQYLFGYTSSESFSRFGIYRNGAQLIFSTYSHGSPQFTLPSTGWYHVAWMLLENQSIVAYVNGKRTVGSGSEYATNTHDVINVSPTIGADRDTGDGHTGYMSGKVAQVQLFNAKLTKQQVNLLAQGLVAGSPVSKFEFDDTIDLPYLSGAKALRCAGSTAEEYLDIPGDPTIAASGAMTFCCWIKPSLSSGEAYCYIFINDLIFAWASGTELLSVYHTTTWKTHTVKCDADVWNHVAVQRDTSGNAYFAVNGVIEAVADGTDTDAMIFDHLLYDDDVTDRNWCGDVADCRLYNAELTEAQLRQVIDGTDYTTGLVAQWKFDDVPRTVSGCADGYSLNFVNGNYVDTKEYTLTGTGARSIAFWFKIADTPSVTEYFLHECPAVATNRGLSAFVSGSGMYVRICDTSGTFVVDINVGTGYFDGAWHSCVFTWDGTTDANKAILYIDGTSQATDTAQATTQGVGDTTNTFQIGRNATGFDGILDLIAVDDGTEWTPAQVTSFHSAGDIPSSATAVWTLDDGPQYGELSAGDPIAVWETHVGQRVVFEQEDPTRRPVYNLDGDNQPYLDFDGTASVLEYAGKLLNQDQGCVLLVVEHDGLAANNYAFGMGDTDSANSYLVFGFNASEQARIQQRSDGDTAAGPEGTNAVSIGSPSVIFFASDGSAYYTDVDGTVDIDGSTTGSGDWAADTGATSPVDNTTLGALKYNSSISSYFDGHIYEVYIWDGPPNLEDDVRNQASIMAQKYGV